MSTSAFVPLVELLLVVGSAGATAGWIALSVYALTVARRRAVTRATVSTVIGLLAEDALRDRPRAERVARLHPLLAGASREQVMHAAADSQTPPAAAAVLA